MTDDIPDITQPKTFTVYAVLMIIFGVIIGIGFHITFTGLHISFWQGIDVMFILLITGMFIAILFHKIPDVVKEIIGQNEDDNDDEDDEEDDE
jgi:divalent metal cation (Fe/Co/Zn/Cd) transporter